MQAAQTAQARGSASRIPCSVPLLVKEHPLGTPVLPRRRLQAAKWKNQTCLKDAPSPSRGGLGWGWVEHADSVCLANVYCSPLTHSVYLFARPSRVSARRPTFFSLLRQRKEGKRKATLLTVTPPYGGATCFGCLEPATGQTRCAQTSGRSKPRLEPPKTGTVRRGQVNGNGYSNSKSHFNGNINDKKRLPRQRRQSPVPEALHPRRRGRAQRWPVSALPSVRA